MYFTMSQVKNGTDKLSHTATSMSVPNGFTLPKQGWN
jgi:hypothetical protein